MSFDLERKPQRRFGETRGQDEELFYVLVFLCLQLSPKHSLSPERRPT